MRTKNLIINPSLIISVIAKYYAKDMTVFIIRDGHLHAEAPKRWGERLLLANLHPE